ncbi:hypothetical protein G9P44_003501 [Scheffersomyces stipitis]|nr:hypothetical protein G9P44_003501 [Scheffersomyces stipitis]
MSFNSPPSELVSGILDKLSFSGQNGLTLIELWDYMTSKLQFNVLDDFQKQIIWQWLFFSNDDNTPLLLYVTRGDEPLTILPDYKAFVEYEGGENKIRILVTSDTQWRYLTGLEPSKKARVSLGEKPFELLCEIAKYGISGILSPDLCKATGQDPRSLPLRFKKLEECGFIVRKNVYDEKSRQHTSLCVHSKFSGQWHHTETSEEQTHKNAFKLRQLIVSSVKSAPNNLRSFKDLKKELKMDKTKSSGKFFGAIVEYLHKNGYVEKLMVKIPEDDQLVYSIRYVKDLPKDICDLTDYVEVFNSIDSNVDEESNFIEDKPVADNHEAQEVPYLNNFFPLSNQVLQNIVSSQDSGQTSKEIVRNLAGISGYRPFTRVLDSLASYVVDDHMLLPLKSYKDLYDDLSLVRSYDYEGKFKLYRYFTRGEFKSSDVKEHKSQKNNGIISKLSLLKLNDKNYDKLGKIPKGDLMVLRKRINTAPEVRHLKRKKIEDNTRSSRKARKRERVNYEEQENVVDEAAIEVEDDIQQTGGVTIDSLKPIAPIFEAVFPKLRNTNNKRSVTSSLKGGKRRTELLEIIKELGGVTYTTAKLRRLLDKRLGNSTATDIKTLARDISSLIASKDLDVETIAFCKTGQQITRKLLILTEEEYRPSSEQIQLAKDQCISDVGENRNQKSRRIIESEVTLFSSTGLRKMRQREGRLESLGQADEFSKPPRRKPAKKDSTNAFDSSEVPIQIDVTLPKLASKKHRRRSKPNKRINEGTISRSPRRYKSSSKFDKSDATTLFRAIVISKTFMRGSIDFDAIASLFDDMDGKSVKQKWTVVRKSVGGLAAVAKGIEAFEHIIQKGIEDDLVSSEDLENIKFKFFLDLWKDSDGSVLDIEDKMPLFRTKKENSSAYSKVQVSESSSNLYDQLEDNSMRQKESILSGVTFFRREYKLERKENDEIRTILKAMFATAEENFSQAQVKKILSEFGDDITYKASTALIKDKEVYFYATDGSSDRFVLTDRVYNALSVKITSKFLNQATKFEDNLSEIFHARKGIILSQGILGGQVCSLLHLISNEVASLVHIDKSYKFDGYESRLIDKEKLSCDIVVHHGKKNIRAGRTSKVHVPTGRACSHFWIDLNGNINDNNWKRIILAVLYYIHFRPGIPYAALHYKLHTVLGVRDYESVIKWLVESNCVTRGEDEGLWVSSGWYSILGF